MRIGILSDIHSNIYALREAVAALEERSCDEYFLLGDYVSDTPYTRETLDFLYDFIATHTCHILRGNREEYMLNQKKAHDHGISSDKWLYNSASGNLLQSYLQLEKRDFEFFDSLPISFTFEREGLPKILCAHGSPTNTRELMQFWFDSTDEWMRRIDEEYLICAHTHLPGVHELEGRRYFNPGCVGIAIEDAGIAQCMMIEDYWVDGNVIWKPEFIRVPYDNMRVIRDIVDSGILDKAVWYVNNNINILYTGEDLSLELVRIANELAGNAGQIWPHIDEGFFEEAARQVGLPDYRGRF